MFRTESFKLIECPYGSSCTLSNLCMFKHINGDNNQVINNVTSTTTTTPTNRVSNNRISIDKDPRLNKNVNNNSNSNINNNSSINNNINNINNINKMINNSNNNNNSANREYKPNFNQDDYGDFGGGYPSDDEQFNEYNPSDDDPIDLDAPTKLSSLVSNNKLSPSPVQTHIPLKKRVQFDSNSIVSTANSPSSPPPKPVQTSFKSKQTPKPAPAPQQTSPPPQQQQNPNISRATKKQKEKEKREKEQREQEEREREIREREEEREQKEKEEAEARKRKRGKVEVEQNPNEAQKLKTSIWNPTLKGVLSKPPNKEMLELISKEDIYDENKWNALGVDPAHLPTILVESRTRVPKSVRQIMIFYILEKCLDVIQDKRRAIEEATKIEDKIYADSLSKNVYLNLIYIELPKILKLIKQREEELFDEDGE